MTNGRFIARLTLAAVPAAAVGVAVSFFQIAPHADSSRLVIYAGILAAMILILSVEVLWLLYGYVRWRPRVVRLGRERAFLSERTKFLEGRLALLQDDVEVLSAVREMARAAAHESVDDVLEETLSIVQDLLSAEWVTIFIRDEKQHRLVPKAHRRGSGTYMGDAIPAELIDDTNVDEAFRYETTIKTVEDERLQAAIPALSGGEKRGVIVVNAPLVGTVEEKRQRIELLESGLRDIAEHLAYALRAMSLQTRAFEDDLTALGARGLFDERIDEFVALSLRKNQPLSLVLADIDHFKNVNDSHGHQVGDHILRDVAGIIKRSLRSYDSAYRYGGEELAILLPQTELKDAVKLAERIRERLEKHRFTSLKLHNTASFGAATLGGEVLSPKSLVAAADRELYRAKALGRNRVEPASALESSKTHHG